MAPSLTQDEKLNRLVELRARLESETIEDDYFKSDGYLINWLEEKKYKVEKAEVAIKKSLAWRKENKIASILEEKFDADWMPTEQTMIGHDISNRPVVVCRPKDVLLTDKEFEGILKKAIKDKAQTLRYLSYEAELVRIGIGKAAKEQGRSFATQDAQNPLIRSVTVIYDMKAVKITDYTKYAKLAFPLAQEILKIEEEHYPSILHHCYVINSPKKLIRLMMTMLRPVVNSSFLDRFSIFGRKQVKWEPALLAAIPKEQLLTIYGGTKEV